MKNKMKWLLIVSMCLGVLGGCASNEESTQIVEMTTNDMVQPLGIDETPYFSWKMKDSKEGQKQSAYQIMLGETKEDLENSNFVWDTGKVLSDESVGILYDGDELEAEKDYFWQIRVWDKEEKEILSDVSSFEMGKMSSVWNNTEWITSFKESHESEGVSSEQAEILGKIEYNFKMEQMATGFVWGAKEGQYGKHYKLSFNVTDGQIEMTLARMEKEKLQDEETIVVLEDDAAEFLENEHRVCISVEENNASVSVDDKLVLQGVELQDLAIGEIGFWVARSENKAWYDNICVLNSEGQTVYWEDFEQEKNIFSPYYLKVEDGWARADSGFVITPGAEVPAPMFRKEFETEKNKKIEDCRLYISAMGIYDVYLNDIDVNEFYGAPGQSVYSKEVYYRTYDITEYIEEGKNVIGVLLGHGRYDRAKGKWGDELGLYAQIVITYEDGTKQEIGTDETWLVCNNGPIRSDDLYIGEYYDANCEWPGWTSSGFAVDKNGEWRAAEYFMGAEGVAVKAAPDNGVKCLEIVTPISVTEPVPGVYVYDFGKNLNGVCRLKLSGKAGETVVVRHAEFLNQENLQKKDDEIGTIWTRNLCTADNTDYYTFKEDGTIVYTPTFSYRGFRYLQITGIEEAIPVEDVEGLFLATDNERTGFFECSDQSMNELYNAIYLTQLNNYVDIPTDCAQRDERLGWAGDVQVYAYTGSLNSYTARFIDKYIDALRASQNQEGAYQHIVPFSDSTDAANGWSDAGVILVWEMYQQYGNKQVIVENLQAMCKYIDHLVDTSEEYIRKQVHYNDHNAISYMDDACCNTAQSTYVAGLVAKMCGIVGEEELENKYKEIYDNYLTAWREAFLNEDGSIGQWLPSEYVIPLAYGLYPEELEKAGAEKLNIAVEATGHRATTGYIATPHILSVLCKYGYKYAAYKMIQQTGYPSWNYMLEQGVSTLTEGWNSVVLNEDGTISINGSLNHVALGAVGQWFYTDVLGIRRDEEKPGYKHFYLEPQIGGGLTYAKGSYNSIYGNIESSWEVTDDGIKFRFVIPANTSATMTLPGEEYQNVKLESGEHEFIVPVQ